MKFFGLMVFGLWAIALALPCPATGQQPPVAKSVELFINNVGSTTIRMEDIMLMSGETLRSPKMYLGPMQTSTALFGKKSMSLYGTSAVLTFEIAPQLQLNVCFSNPYQTITRSAWIGMQLLTNGQANVSRLQCGSVETKEEGLIQVFSYASTSMAHPLEVTLQGHTVMAKMTDHSHSMMDLIFQDDPDYRPILDQDRPLDVDQTGEQDLVKEASTEAQQDSTTIMPNDTSIPNIGSIL